VGLFEIGVRDRVLFGGEEEDRQFGAVFPVFDPGDQPVFSVLPDGLIAGDDDAAVGFGFLAEFVDMGAVKKRDFRICEDRFDPGFVFFVCDEEKDSKLPAGRE